MSDTPAPAALPLQYRFPIGAEQTSLRKLSMTIHLAEGAEHEGGDLDARRSLAAWGSGPAFR